MDREILSCIAYPTTIILVDDDKQFPKKIAFMLGKHYFLQPFSDPKEALKFLKENYQFDPFINRCALEQEDISPDHRVVDYNIRSIREEVFNHNRFKEISIVILDYAMPDINGGELAKSLSNKPFKIILLTGEASTQKAVTLFNEGVIHSYIRKDDPALKELLIQSIEKLQQQYFRDISKTLLDNFSKQNWLQDPVYRALFDKVRKENNIVEYYLIDEYGSYQFLTSNGKTSFLAVTNTEMMETYLLYTKDYEMPKKVLEGIQSKTMMPFFLNDDDFNLPPSEWASYMHPAGVLQGLETYYYTYIANPDPNIYHLKDKILSYDKFLVSQEI